ncbi:biosynthetic arginine decarboxylase [Sulfuricurvum sp.]|uniref:biosynthetic arginine decarboxylase n=1 Tax=Sulfuricurvum sp. TaxID=2025608 RepID=UPI0025FECA39|nr:biosynthetic arginine decarboxylase [Sulfuricurvum sp.]
MKTYGIDIWGENNFMIDQGKIKVNYKSSPSLLEITQKVRKTNLRGPLILRFPHLISKQIDALYSNFRRAIFENDYTGKFHAVFPLKVNQFPEAVDAIVELGEKYSYGLEAGSKAELALAMAKTAIGSPITVNGFKDEEMVTLGFMAAQMGHNITITIEGLGELEWIIDVAQSCGLKVPNIGIRVRLQSEGSGIWAKSSGMSAKFGLTSTELIEAMLMLQENNMLEHFSMIHFHIGSQMQDIAPLKRVLREAGNIYAELKKMGADNLCAINIGGGLAVEYSQHTSTRMRNYTLEEFSNSVVFLLREIMNAKGVTHPDIFTESGRFIVASHSVLIAPVLELFSHDYQAKSLKLKENNPPLIEELRELNSLLSPRTCIEYMHDALDHMESLLTLFNLGHIDLQDRSNAEILVHQIIKKSLYLSQDNPMPEIERLQVKLQERYLINTSIFQSIPDYWGLQQQFPIMPLDRLDIPAIRAASLWDITCDSDGEIRFQPETPLYLHDIDLDEEEYFLAFFNVGAYQETLGMNHNLFTHPSECTILISDTGYEIENFTESDNVLNILEDIGYDASKLLTNLKNKLASSDFRTEEEKSDTLQKLEMYLYQNGYLRTTR